MRQYERVYPPEVTSDDFAIDDDITLRDVYVHNFTLSYVISDDVIQEVTTATFTFGKQLHSKNILVKCGYLYRQKCFSDSVWTILTLP